MKALKNLKVYNSKTGGIAEHQFATNADGAHAIEKEFNCEFPHWIVLEVGQTKIRSVDEAKLLHGELPVCPVPQTQTRHSSVLTRMSDLPRSACYLAAAGFSLGSLLIPNAQYEWSDEKSMLVRVIVGVSLAVLFAPFSILLKPKYARKVMIFCLLVGIPAIIVEILV
jgi:hypothetical protein